MVIVGAGLIGASLALKLAQQPNLRVAVLERNQKVEENAAPNQRVVALGSAATTLLNDIDVFAQLGSEFCHPYQDMHVWDENSAGELHFSASEHGYAQLGYMIDSLECVRLLQRELAASASIDTHFGVELTSIRFADGIAQLHTSEHDISAQLLVAADGGRSWVRQQAKIFANHASYRQQGIVARIHTEQSHQDTAWQRFLSSGPIAILPLHDNQSSIVWSIDDARAEHLMNLTDAEFALELERALESKLGSVKVLSPRIAFPLQSLKAETYVRRNLALVGDAAHSIHPLAGQGANLGFKDIESLSELLQGAAPEDIGSLKLLSRYQRSRQFDNQQTDTMMTALHRAYTNNNPMWITARGLGMNFMTQTKLIKQFLVRQAVGA